MRIAFAGTPPFAARALEAIHAAGHPVCLVLTQPDRPAGRGMRLSASAVAETAQALGLEVLKPASLKDEALVSRVRAASPEILVVAAYGLILPPALLAAAPRGAINIHASLLPRWRGAAPVQRALLAGDETTGITIMRMDAGLDTGDILYQVPCPIGERDSAGTLTDALAKLGAGAVAHALRELDGLVPLPQDNAMATYAPKVSRGEAGIDWRRSNLFVDRQVRAFDPAPGAETHLGDLSLKIREAKPVAGLGAPGEILSGPGLVIACAEGALRVGRLQRAGGKAVPAEEFLRGTPLSPGTRLESAPRPTRASPKSTA